MQPMVSIQNISKHFGAGPRVLQDVSLEAAKGDFVSLIGPSGCGKSTLLKMIAGLVTPTSGLLLVDGVTPRQAHDDLFFVFQEANLLPWLRVGRNVELPLKLRKMAPAQRRERMERLLQLVGLSEAKDQFPWQLSSGMRMRVSIARALSVAPKILLLDEPFGALDEMTRDRLNEDLLSIRERDPFTAFFVTHSVSEAVFLSSRIVVMAAKPGRIEGIIEVPFSYPRTAALRESPEYLQLLAETTHHLREVNQPR